MKNYFLEDLQALKMVVLTTKNSDLAEKFGKTVEILVKAIKRGYKILVCGNGGSAADAEHMAGEIVGRFGYNRLSLPCISLCSPSATFTAIANDYGYENVFKRQVQGLGRKGDILIGISTSGNSANIVEAFKVAKTIDITTIALTGNKESELSALADITLSAGSTKTPRIQEIHGILIHSLCRAIEDEMFCKATSPALPCKKILGNDDLWRFIKGIKNYKSVFTNGCFDVLHPGHVYNLNKCREYGELLIVGLNSDDSIKRLKGPNRPYHSFADRANVLASLESVDYVIGFDEDTPLTLIQRLTPSVLVKGGDYAPENIAGADWVTSHGGKVVILPLLEGHSTTKILENQA